MMTELVYKRLDNRGEIHLVEEGSKFTLCNENCTHWDIVSPVKDRSAQLCPDCKEIKNEMEEEEEDSDE